MLPRYLLVVTVALLITNISMSSRIQASLASNAARRSAIKDTGKTKNLEIKLPPSSSSGSGSRAVLSVDEMEDHLGHVGKNLGMYISHTTVLGRKRYPGNRHWHFKQHPKKPGCLDVTYWPSGELFWISMRNYEPKWVHVLGPELRDEMEKELLVAAENADKDN